LRDEETGQLRILLEDWTLVRVFVHRVGKIVLLRDDRSQFQVEAGRARSRAGWIEAWRARHPEAQIKEWRYTDVLGPVSSYGPGGRWRPKPKRPRRKR
jgi:hypothetical protein